jgi:DpnII restriction endonuclease
MAKNFNLFLDQLSETNATLDYFVDFDKVNNNIDLIKMKLILMLKNIFYYGFGYIMRKLYTFLNKKGGQKPPSCSENGS